MKKILKRLIIGLLKIDWIGNLVKKVSIGVWKIVHQRRLIEQKRVEDATGNTLVNLFTNQVVLNGPFKGLKYPTLRSKSSSLYSKLIGSYEAELHTVFQNAIDKKYDQILDIGCAEGYYAVGLALKIKEAKIYAFDIDAEALELTQNMAKENGVSDRIVVEKKCTADTLAHFKFSSNSLIISDCEGFERFLFNASNIGNLVNTDLIIETHDFVNINISTDLETLFANTHTLQIISSVSDVYKAKNYKYPEVEKLSLETKYQIFLEGRGVTDEWLILSAKR